MVSQQRRLGHRFVAFVSSLVLVAMIAGACASASTATSNVAGSLFGSASTGVNTVPANLPAATTTVAPVIPAAGAAVALQDQFVAVIKQVSPSVVEIDTSSGLGSGVIYDAKGDIVTNAHVVGTSKTFTVTLADGRSFPGTLVGTYAPDDIAVIRINAPGLTVATFGNSSTLSVGDFVLAMGNPLGLQSSVTEGIVSALGRQVTEPTGNVLPDTIQTSAAINPGNSGGALVDLQGNIVGIPTLAATDSQVGGSAPGIGFAISSNRAKVIADQLISGGKVTTSGRAYMGVQLRDGTTGPVLMAVVAGGPADKAGLVVGDIVLEIDSKATPDTSTLIEAVAAHRPGDSVKLKVQHRNATTSTVTLTLAELPA
jgi:putative serine protease PepD